MTIAQRYEVVMLARQGHSLNSLHHKYSTDARTIKRLVSRYDKYGLDGLKDRKVSHYPERIKLAALTEYETETLSLAEVCDRYDLTLGTFKLWLKQYESYKQGDKYALNGGGAIRKCDQPFFPSYAESSTQTRHMMPESKEKQERREALNSLSKKELKELLLDREAELDILKNLDALIKERENKRHAILRKLSKD